MPLYEFECLECGKFEDFKGIDEAWVTLCPWCGRKSQRILSTFTLKLYNPFTKDGEGFTSQTYRKEEYRERVKNNMGKYER